MDANQNRVENNVAGIHGQNFVLERLVSLLNLRRSAVEVLHTRSFVSIRGCFLSVLCVSVVKLFGYERLGYLISGREAGFCG